MSKISIIVPVYNAEKYLKRCVDSLLAQSFSGFEMLLINDGSTDNSGEICDEIAQNHSFVKIIHTSNQGVSAARNVGLNHASGEYIMFLDADDRLAPNAIESLNEEIIKEDKPDLIVFGIKQDNGNMWSPSNNMDYKTREEFLYDFLFHLNSEILSPCWNKIYKKTLITKGFNEDVKFGEDLIFVLNYLKNCSKIKFIINPLYLHNNMNEASVTRNFSASRIYDIECYQREILNFHTSDEQPAFDKYLRDTIKWLHSLLRSNLSHRKIREIVNDWMPDSYLLKLKLSDFAMSGKDKIMLYSVKWRLEFLYLLALKCKR